MKNLIAEGISLLKYLQDAQPDVEELQPSATTHSSFHQDKVNEAKAWIRYCRLQYANIPERDLFRVAGIYEFLCPMGIGKRPDRDFIDLLLDRYYRAWLRHAPGISDSDMTEFLLSERRRLGSAMPPDHLAALSHLLTLSPHP